MDNSGSSAWDQWTHFGGFDWAKDHHDVVVVDRNGQIVLELRIADDAEGWHQLRQKVQAFPALAVAVETSQGAVVERLLEAGLAVFPVNPKAASRYRDRKAPSGTKTDHLDAWSLADALRVDGHQWRRLKVEDPLIQELRLLCRDEIHLIEQRTAFVNQLQQALWEYFPVALQAFTDWTAPAAWAFIEQFPTPQAVAKAGQRRWEKFLHAHKLYRPQTYQKRLDQFAKVTEFCGSTAVTNAKSRLAVTLAKQLRVLEAQLGEYRARIRKLFEQHPDHDLFGSLPGLGEKLAPRMLGECGDDRDRFDDTQSLQCYAGTAPVSYQSGQLHKVHFRRACDKYLRATVHLWANLSRTKCAWAEAYYQKKRSAGQSHACALRCLGQRWLKILWKMWQTRTPYDEAYHACNQVRHGSWVIALTSTAQTT
jgi:transposase